MHFKLLLILPCFFPKRLAVAITSPIATQIGKGLFPYNLTTTYMSFLNVIRCLWPWIHALVCCSFSFLGCKPCGKEVKNPLEMGSCSRAGPGLGRQLYTSLQTAWAQAHLSANHFKAHLSNQSLLTQPLVMYKYCIHYMHRSCTNILVVSLKGSKTPYN